MEADLTDYSGMSLSGVSGSSNQLVSKLAPSEQDESVKVSGTTPHSLPWRVFMIGEQAGDFIESPLVYNLNDPGKLEDVSWVEPGKAVWPWWSGRIAKGKPFSGEPNTALMKYYTDFAVRHNIPYLLVDAGWYSMEGDAWDQPEKENILTMEETRKDDYNIREVINYANEQGIKVLLWMHMGSMMTKEKVDQIFPTVADWGAKGIKVDYFGGESQDLVSHLHYIFEKAAEHELLIDYHGAYKPTGVHRTYPNFITSEAIKGLEYSKGNPEPKPKHNVTIPYTRMLGGPMDYTSGAFDLDGTEDHPKHVQTTRAHQMAMYAVYFSPLQMLVDYPRAYESAQDQFEFIKQVPVTWDDTRFLQGEPGEYVAVARKKGNDWFVGVMNNEQSGREVTLSLNFLEEGSDYTAHIYRDADDADQNPEHVTVEEQTVTAGDEHSVTLASGGGEAIWLEKH
jgi:alpha-glucosidase